MIGSLAAAGHGLFCGFYLDYFLSSTISVRSQSSALHILTKTSVLTFSPLPSFVVLRQYLGHYLREFLNETWTRFEASRFR